MSILNAVLDVKTVPSSEEVAKPKSVSLLDVIKEELTVLVLSGVSFVKEDLRSQIPQNVILKVSDVSDKEIKVTSPIGDTFAIDKKDFSYFYRADEYLAYTQAYYIHRLYLKDEAIDKLKIERDILLKAIKEK